MDLKYVDLVYFGYYHEPDSAKHQDEFILEITDKFENVKLDSAFDDIKGYRQEVYLEESEKDNYFTWLIGKGWYEASLTMQLLMMSPDRREEFLKYFDLAKKQYPEAFKPECL